MTTQTDSEQTRNEQLGYIKVETSQSTYYGLEADEQIMKLRGDA